MRANHWPSMMEGFQSNLLAIKCWQVISTALYQIYRVGLHCWKLEPCLWQWLLQLWRGCQVLTWMGGLCSCLQNHLISERTHRELRKEADRYPLIRWVGILSTWSLRTSFTVGTFRRAVSTSGPVLRDPFTFSSPDHLVTNLQSCSF